MEFETDGTTLNLKNSEVEEIKLDEETNVSMKSRILSSLKNTWYYFQNKFMNLLACTIKTGGNINNVKEPLVVEEEREVPVVVDEPVAPIIEEPVVELEAPPCEQPVSMPSTEVVIEEYLPIATPVVVEQPITIEERI